MPSIVIPAPIGEAVNTFNQGLLSALELRRRFDRDDQLAKLETVRLQQGQMALDEQRRGAEEASMVRSVVPQVMGMPARSVEVAPGVPAQLQTAVDPGDDPELGRFLPRTVVPAQPPTTVSELTMNDVTQQVGPTASAAMLTSPQGRAALAARGVITEEEADRRRKRAASLERFKKSQTDSTRLYQEGKGEEGLLAERASFQAMAEVADDPTRVMQQARDLTTAYMALREKKEQIPLLNDDMQKLSKALATFKARPDFDTHATLLQAATSMQSDFGKKKGIELLQKIAQGQMDEIKFLPFRQVERRVAEILDESDRAGKPMERKKALQQSLREQPQLTAEIVGTMAASGKFPADYAEVLFGGPVAKNDQEEVDQALTARGFVRGSTEYTDEFTKRLTDLRRQRERGNVKDQGLDRLVTLRGQAMQEVNNLQRSLKDAESDEERADIKGRIDFIQNTRIPSLDASIEGRPAVARPAATAAGATPPAPVPTPPGGPPARAVQPPTLGKDRKPIQRKELEEAATAEGKRLIGRGHTKETAIAEMKKRGWPVK